MQVYFCFYCFTIRWVKKIHYLKAFLEIPDLLKSLQQIEPEQEVDFMFSCMFNNLTFKSIQNTNLLIELVGIFSSLSIAVKATASSVATFVLHKELMISLQYSGPGMVSPSIVTLLCFPNSEKTMGNKDNHLVIGFTCTILSQLNF